MSTIYRKPIRWRSPLGTVIGDPPIDPSPKGNNHDQTSSFQKKCSDCGKSIPAARLKAMPNTHRCAACQAAFERQNPVTRRLPNDDGIAGTREDCKRERARQSSDMKHRSMGHDDSCSSTKTIKRSAPDKAVKQGKQLPVKKHGSITQRVATKRRKSATSAEAELQRILNELNNGILKGRFIREWAFEGHWILDFFFHEIRLGIEVDGPSHKLPAQMIVDRMKELTCKELDITLIRVTNKEVFGNQIKLVQKLREGWKQAISAKKRRMHESSKGNDN
ncbi:MAG: TraR/DksA C4-type zinc finger protein [Syntrophales bacterium]